MNSIKSFRLYYGIFILYVFIALFASILANEKPLFLSMNGKSYFPALSKNPYIEISDSNGNLSLIRTNNIDWKNLKADRIIFAPVCWHATHSDLNNLYSSPFEKQFYYKDNVQTELPFRFRHFLGTGKTGNDVLAGLIHGTRTSVSIGLISMTIAIFLGILFGAIAGYLGDNKLKLTRGSLIASSLMIIPAWFYGFQLRNEILVDAFSISSGYGVLQIFFSIFIFKVILIWPILLKFPSTYLNKKIFIPVDSIISRIIEIFLSLPRLILILTLAAISRPSATSIILIIGLTSWTEIARLMRARILQLKEMNYIAAAQTIGTDHKGILLRHLLPNSLSQIIVVGIFGIASAILVETGLSFLGIGVPVDTPTWGSLMFEARENYHAWWLVVFTGLAIFSLLSSLYIFGNKIRKSESKITLTYF